VERGVSADLTDAGGANGQSFELLRGLLLRKERPSSGSANSQGSSTPILLWQATCKVLSLKMKRSADRMAVEAPKERARKAHGKLRCMPIERADVNEGVDEYDVK
jgi:hypothetical protein